MVINLFRFLYRYWPPRNRGSLLKLGGYTGAVKYERHDLTAADDELGLLEAKLSKMGLASESAAEEGGEFEMISQRELQEVPEWRTDY